MIIFYDLKTGDIVGSIGGKKHYKGEENFWVGDRTQTERLLYDVSAPYFEEYHKDPLAARKFRINRLTLELEPTGVD